MERKPLIFEIKGNSLDDGPGIRTVLFFKGCPLSCIWCHNPEGIKTGEEISFNPNVCIGCDSCIQVCKDQALDRSLPFFIDQHQCTHCFDCIPVCPSGALSRVGQYYAIQDLIQIIKKDQPFFQTSGGGVTLSGGEPMLYMDYVSSLIKELKSDGISILLETSGYFCFNRFETLIAPYIDQLYMDIKIMNEEEHKQFCGVSNKVILNNFKGLLKLSREGMFSILPRIPLIPNITTQADNLKAIAHFLQENGVPKAALLPYNPLWGEKVQNLGRELHYNNKNFMSMEEQQQCEHYFSNRDIELVH